MGTTIKLPVQTVEKLAGSAIDRIKVRRQRLRDDALTRLMTRRRWFGYVAPYTRDEAEVILDSRDNKMADYNIMSWGALADAERLWRTAVIAHENGAFMMEVSSADADVLQPRKD